MNTTVSDGANEVERWGCVYGHRQVTVALFLIGDGVSYISSVRIDKGIVFKYQYISIPGVQGSIRRREH